MHERMQTLASGAILVLIIGWILYVGKAVFVPIVFGSFAVYVTVGLARVIAQQGQSGTTTARLIA